MQSEPCLEGVAFTPVENCSMFRRLPTFSGTGRAKSEATFRSSAGERAATPLRPSTPHNVSRSSPPNQEYCGQSEDRILHHTAQCDTVCFERVRSQLPAGALQLDQTKTMRARMMRGVITGPARWRGANASCGTPNLYCAVYKYSFTQCVVHSSASSAQSSSRSPESGYLPLPPPKLVSSTWGQGPLVIDGVPVLERHANTLGEYAEKGSPCGDELQSIFVSVGYAGFIFWYCQQNLAPQNAAPLQSNYWSCRLCHAGLDSGSFPQSYNIN